MMILSSKNRFDRLLLRSIFCEYDLKSEGKATSAGALIGLKFHRCGSLILMSNSSRMSLKPSIGSTWVFDRGVLKNFISWFACRNSKVFLALQRQDYWRRSSIGNGFHSFLIIINGLWTAPYEDFIEWTWILSEFCFGSFCHLFLSWLYQMPVTWEFCGNASIGGDELEFHCFLAIIFVITSLKYVFRRF